jgi:predicted nucleic acid-binding protein
VILFDTSVIIDARDADSLYHAWAKERIAEAVAGDGASANTVVVSEASVRASNRDAVPGLLAALLILTEAAALALAGELIFLRRAPLASCPANYFVFI